ncbi:hypothetical protein HZ326_22306 [Fusarium oxysporum f. sp. albedinis]|nr:hypothetical protein HZ326_22306 [Fusarium oxysporum f. sp. albedinis]
MYGSDVQKAQTKAPRVVIRGQNAYGDNKERKCRCFPLLGVITHVRSFLVVIVLCQGYCKLACDYFFFFGPEGARSTFVAKRQKDRDVMSPIVTLHEGQEQAFCQPKHSGSGGSSDQPRRACRRALRLVPCVLGFDSYSRTWRILEMQLHPPLLINEETIRRNSENLTIWSSQDKSAVNYMVVRSPQMRQ